MKLEREVVREIKKMAVGCAVCSLIVAAVFAVIGKFDYTVLVGAAVGWLLSFGNFFFMTLGVIKALDTGDESAAKLKMHSSYIARTVVMLAVMAVAIIADFIHWVPVVVSVFYPRIVITAVNLVAFAKSRKKHLAGEDEPMPDETADPEKTAENSCEYDDDGEEEDGFEKFAKSFYKAPVPGEEKNNGKKS